MRGVILKSKIRRDLIKVCQVCASFQKPKKPTNIYIVYHQSKKSPTEIEPTQTDPYKPEYLLITGNLQNGPVRWDSAVPWTNCWWNQPKRPKDALSKRHSPAIVASEFLDVWPTGEPRNKPLLLSIIHTGWFIGILMVAYYNPNMTR